MKLLPVARRIALVLPVLAALAASGGCTLFDDYVDGTPFTPDQPVAEVSLMGPVYLDPAARTSRTCAPGTTVIWGWVKNTGDLDVDDVTAVLDVFGVNGAFLGSYRDKVYSGEIIAGEDTGSFDSASTMLAVEQSGTFNVCSSLPFGTVGRVEFRAEFVVIDIEEF